MWAQANTLYIAWGEVPEWLIGAVCKIAALTGFTGSNPVLSTNGLALIPKREINFYWDWIPAAARMTAVHLNRESGACLRFGICDLGFNQRPLDISRDKSV